MKVIFFDGYCTLCNGLVDWVMRADVKQQIQFASLQGETAKQILVPLPFDLDTVIYLRDGQCFERSTAVLYILQDIGGIWKITSVFFIFPEFIRNLFYRLIARNRYRLFKKRDTCRMPSPQEKARLLP